MKKFAALQLSLIFAFVAFAATPDADLVKLAAESLNGEQLEEMGISEHNMPSAKKTQRKIHLNRLGQVLLIPESGEDVVGMYDPYDGTYLGDLIIEDTLLFDFSTPINAVPGPDNNIYVSDQLEDAVYVFDTSGAYLYTYADASDGLNNIRGIDFRNGHLFVTSGDDYVREFSAPHTVVRDFIADGSDPFDILFLEDGRSLLCDIQGTTDNVRLYDTSGTFLYQLFPVNFPEQVQFDDVLPGAFLTAAFSANTITDFELDGTIIATIPFAGNPRGVYRLGNGNLLGTNGAGIHELDPVTGAIIQTENTGSGRFIELYTAPAAQTYFWDFEDGEQGWTHTNGGTFPAAWDVVSSSYVVSTYTIAPPDAGDSSFCIDGYLGGICHDTAMSPVVDNPGFSYFKWGMHFQQYVSYQTFTVIMRTFSSGVWNAWTDVWTYTADTPPRYDSVDISGTVADSVQVGFVYDQPNATYAWFAAFDNVELVIPPEHDVACMAVVSPPEGAVPVATYDVTGNIRNLGSTDETFDVVGHVYDTTGMVLVFDQTVNLTLTAGADTDLVLGQVAFNADSYYYTEIFTTLVGDVDPSNDTSSIYSRTAISLGDVIYELDVQTITGNNRLLGVEFDGTNFYVTGGMSSSGNDSIWVIDTFGTVVCRVGQPTNSIWGLRDLAWDGVYAGSDRIDTLYASDESGLYKFGINLTGSLDNYGTITGPVLPCRALAWDPDDEWFFTANWDPYYKFSKTSPFIDSVSGPGSSYGAAYDTDADSGGWVWWHSQLQVDPGYLLRIDQMDAVTMSWSGLFFGYIPPSLPPSATSNMAGGLCFHEGFRGMDVLFTLVQGDPVDEIVGLYIRDHVTAINEQPDEAGLLVFGFAPGMSTVHRNHVPICYSTTAPSHVSLKVYDNTGRLVRTLVDTQQPAGEKSVLWDNKDLNKRVVANGVYFLKLEAQGETAVQKLVFLK
jgi:hypothetical protein